MTPHRDSLVNHEEILRSRRGDGEDVVPPVDAAAAALNFELHPAWVDGAAWSRGSGRGGRRVR